MFFVFFYCRFSKQTRYLQNKFLICSRFFSIAILIIHFDYFLGAGHPLFCQAAWQGNATVVKKLLVRIMTALENTVLPRNNLPPRLSTMPASCVHTARVLPPERPRPASRLLCPRPASKTPASRPQRVTASTWTQSSEHNRKNEQHIGILVIIRREQKFDSLPER